MRRIMDSNEARSGFDSSAFVQIIGQPIGQPGVGVLSDIWSLDHAAFQAYPGKLPFRVVAL